MPNDKQMIHPLTIVAAHDAQRGIGFENELPWKIPEDLAHFKRVTLGKPVIMGRRTFDSIGQPLPGRLNIVITRQTLWCRAGAKVAHSLEEAIAMANGPASIIGGSEIFEQAMAVADRVVITEIAETFTCDTFFPKLNENVWRKIAYEPAITAAGLHLAYVTYERRTKAETRTDGNADGDRNSHLPVRALARHSFTSDAAYDVYCAEVEGWFCRLSGLQGSASDAQLTNEEAAGRVVSFLERIDAKLVEADFTMQQRHAVFGALWSIRLNELPNTSEGKTP